MHGDGWLSAEEDAEHILWLAAAIFCAELGAGRAVGYDEVLGHGRTVCESA